MREAVVRSKHRIFGGKTALVAGALHKHALPVDVSCCEDMRHIALQVVVDRDITAFGQHASSSKVERIHIARPASRKEDRVYRQAGGTLLLAVVQSDNAIGLFQALGSSISNDGNPLLTEGIGEG